MIHPLPCQRSKVFSLLYVIHTLFNSILTLISFPGDRIGFVVDRTVAALLMMGNISPDLKPHAVTLYEVTPLLTHQSQPPYLKMHFHLQVGKIASEDLPSFLAELKKNTVDSPNKGEALELGAAEYFNQAVMLFHTMTKLLSCRPTGTSPPSHTPFPLF